MKPPGRKRKIFLTISLSLSLLFGKPRLGSSQSSSPNFDNQEVHERVISNELKSLKDSRNSDESIQTGTRTILSFQQKIILVKDTGNSGSFFADSFTPPSVIPPTRGSRPNSFPVSPPSGGRPSRPVSGVNPYTITPKVVDQGLGAGGNPAGAGGANLDDQCPAPKKEQSQESSTHHHDFTQKSKKNKKQSSEQCELKEEFKKDENYGGFAYKLDKNGNPIIKVNSKDGSEILLTYDKALEKYYHQDVYKLEKPKNFDSAQARSLKPKDRLEYLKKTVPRDKVIEFQIANAKSLSTENILPVPGFIGAKKEPGRLYINKETGQVHFVNDRTNIWRTTVIKTRTGLINLAQNYFHLFPNAGK